MYIYTCMYTYTDTKKKKTSLPRHFAGPANGSIDGTQPEVDELDQTHIIRHHHVGRFHVPV